MSVAVLQYIDALLMEVRERTGAWENRDVVDVLEEIRYINCKGE